MLTLKPNFDKLFDLKMLKKRTLKKPKFSLKIDFFFKFAKHFPTYNNNSRTTSI